MSLLMKLAMPLINLLSFYAYPIVCFDISPVATAMAAGFVLLGAVVQGCLLYRRKRAARFPVLCAAVAAASFLLIYLMDVWNRLAERGDPLIPISLSMIVFSVAAAYVLLGALAGWLIYRTACRARSGK